MNQSAAIISAFLTDYRDSSPEICWRAFIELHRQQSFEVEQCRKVWRQVFAQWNGDQGPPPCWIPGEKRVARSNVANWMEQLNLQDVHQFHQWTAHHRNSFWAMVLDELNIAFRREPDSIMAPRSSAEKPEWLPGARFNIVESCFQASGDQLALISGDSSGAMTYRSYRELQERANQVGNCLLSEGFQQGDCFGVIMPVSFESIAIYLGIIQAGMVTVSIADSFAGQEIDSRLQIANAKAVFSYEFLERSGKRIPLGDRVRDATALPVYTVATDAGESGVVSSAAAAESWQERLEGQPTEFEAVVGNPSDPINVLFSSGTTGDPKAIPWNHTTPIKCAMDGMLHLDLVPGDVVAWPTNLGWMMGPWLIFATLINRGTIAVYDDAPMGSGFGAFVESAKVNVLGVIPSLVRVWRQSGCNEPYDWSSIKTYSSTGEASNADDMFYLSWLAGFKPIIEYCGGTEIGGGYISSTVVQNNAPASFSTPAFGLDVEILSDSIDASAGEEDRYRAVENGELFISPPSIGLSIDLLNRDHSDTYFKSCPKKNGIRLRRHGDFFQKLGGGYYAAGGRTDDTMNLGGIKVSSVEIECILNQLPGLSESAAVAIPLEESGPDCLVVFYVVEPDVGDGDLSSEPSDWLHAMNQAIRSQLNPLFKIRKIIPRDSLPRTASNKIMRRKLRSELC